MTPSCWAVLGPCWPCWAVLCRAEPLDGPSSTAGARPAPDRPLRLRAYFCWASWGLQRGRAPSGALGLAVQLGHGQCPTQLHGESPAAGYELLVTNDLQQHAPPAAGRRSGPGMGAGRTGTAGPWSACATKWPSAASRGSQQSPIRLPSGSHQDTTEPLDRHGGGQGRAGQTRSTPSASDKDSDRAVRLKNPVGRLRALARRLELPSLRNLATGGGF
jgi:hypothetical protein